MKQRLTGLGRLLITLVVLLPAYFWGATALQKRLPFDTLLKSVIVALFVAAMINAIILFWKRQRLLMLAVLVVTWGLLLGWWATILPRADRDWQPDMARIADARIDGDVLTVANVRNFGWRSDDDFTERWETRTYHLSRLTGADLFLSYWAGESIAHAIVSFTFTGSDPLAFSIEIRKERGESYSATAGFFKTYELALIAADERDVVKVRSTVRGEDVRLYRLDIQRATALGLLREYVALSRDVTATPRWYNTLTANCTTVIFGMARKLDPRVAMDWRILLPGRLPEYLREHEFVTRAVPLTELTERSHIGPRAAGPAPDAEFSARIREGVPQSKETDTTACVQAQDFTELARAPDVHRLDNAYARLTQHYGAQLIYAAKAAALQPDDVLAASTLLKRLPQTDDDRAVWRSVADLCPGPNAEYAKAVSAIITKLPKLAASASLVSPRDLPSYFRFAIGLEGQIDNDVPEEMQVACRTNKPQFQAALAQLTITEQKAMATHVIDANTCKARILSESD